MSEVYRKFPARTEVPASLLQDPGFLRHCSYKDQKAVYQLRKLQEHLRDTKTERGSWYVRKFGLDFLKAEIAEVEAKVPQTVIENGTVPSGLLPEILRKWPLPVVECVDYPRFRAHDFRVPPEHPMRWYQEEAVSKLRTIKHGAVQLATGTGKSRIALELVAQSGLKTIIAVPFQNIAEQFYRDFFRAFGASRVGRFWGGKKESKKDIVIAVSRSLVMAKPGDGHYENLQRSNVMIVDESHLIAAKTLREMSEGILGKVPYRWFLSGTQMRADGLETVLRGVIGEIVIELDVKTAVGQGFLSRPRFVQCRVPSANPARPKDPLEQARIHLQDNEEVYKITGAFVKKSLASGRPTLILIDEFPQFTKLWPHISQYRVAFAHGGATAANKGSIDESRWKSDPLALVSAFDAGQYDVLVGTSVVSCGTDIKSVGAIIDLVGGSSEVRIRQAVGRGTRLFPNKKDFIYVDFDITNVETLTRQAAKRAEIFEEIYGPVTKR